MRALISKWGNSLAVRLPKAAAESLRVKAGEAVELAIEGDSLTIRPARPSYRLEDLLAGITPDNRPRAIEFPPAGEEKL